MSPDDPRHGTNAGYTAHLKDKVPPCQPCRVAKNAYMRAYLAAESPDVLTGGRWENVRGVQRWVVDEPEIAPRPLQIGKMIACPTCHARAHQSCRTITGHTTTPHGSRLIARCCPCGGTVKGRRRLCDPCQVEATRQSNRAFRQRRKAA